MMPSDSAHRRDRVACCSQSASSSAPILPLFSSKKRTGDEPCYCAWRTLEHREPLHRRFFQETARNTGRGALKESRIPARAIVPTGRIFPLFLSAHDKSRTSCAVAFVCVAGNGKGVFLVVGRVRLLGKSPFFCWRSACVTGRASWEGPVFSQDAHAWAGHPASLVDLQATDQFPWMVKR
jgi:hypothetical protein